MARIAGVNIPTGKRVVIALQYIHGIGAKFAQEIIEKNSIDAAADNRRQDRRRRLQHRNERQDACGFDAGETIPDDGARSH